MQSKIKSTITRLMSYWRQPLLCAVTVVLTSATSATAQETTHILNRVKALDLDISYKGQKGEWCASRLDLILSTSRPLIYFDNKFVKEQMSALAKRLNKSCPALTKIDVKGFARSEPKVAQLEASYVAEDNWVHSALSLPEQLTQTKTDDSRTNISSPATPDPSETQQQTRQPNRQLSFVEAQELQRRLAFLGFPSGKIDGKPGRKTAAAIRLFLASRNAQLPVRPDLDVLRLVRKASGANNNVRAQTDKDTSQQSNASLADFADLENPQAFDTITHFTLRTFHDQADFLRSDKSVLSAATRLSKSRTSTLRAQTSQLVKAYRSGTTFDRQDALENMRGLFASEVEAAKPILEKPINVLIKSNIRIDQSKYRAGVGFPFYAEIDGLFRIKSNKRYHFYLSPLESSINFQFNVPGFNLVVPILEESNARKLAALSRDRRYQFQLQHYLTTTKPIQLEEGSNPDFFVTTKTRALRLVMIDKKDANQKERLVYQWRVTQQAEQPQAEAAPKGNMEPAAFARWAGIRRLRGQHLILEKPFDSNNWAREQFKPWARFEDVMSINRDPSLLTEESSQKRLAKSFLSPTELDYLTDRKPNLLAMSNTSDYKAFDEFTTREFKNRFASLNLQAAVQRYRPKLPIPIVQIVPADLGEYDFDNERFPISYGRGNNSATVDAGFPLKSVSFHTLQRYPRWLPLQQANAQFLVRKFFPERFRAKRVYLGIFSRLEPQPESEPSDDLVQATTLRLALYLDENLTKKILEVPLKGLTRAAPGEFLVTAEERRKADNALKTATATSLQIAKAAEKLPGADTYLDQYIRTTRAYRSASELDKPGVEQRLANQLKTEPYDETEFWMNATVDLRSYDPANQRFPMRSLRIEKDNTAGLGGNLLISLTNGNDIRYLPVEPNRARKTIRYSRNDGRGRTVSVKLLVKPVSAKILGTGDDGFRNLDLKVEVQKLVAIYKPRKNSRLPPFVIGEQTKGAFARGQANNPTLLQANAVLEVPIASEKQMVVTSAQFADDQETVLQTLVKSSKKYQRINEIDAPQALRSEVEKLSSEYRPEQSYWLGGKIELGNYDTETQQFAVNSIGASYLESDDEDYQAQFSLGLFNSFDFSRFNLPIDQARALLRRRGNNRRFEIRMLVSPKSFNIDADSYCCGPTFEIQHSIQQLHILDEKPTQSGSKEAYVLATVSPTDAAKDETRKQSAEATGERANAGDIPFLTQDMVFARSIAAYEGQLSNQQLRWLAAQQWLADTGGNSGLSTSYFQAGSKISSDAINALQDWYRQLGDTIPKRLKIQWQIDNELQILSEIDEGDSSLSISPITNRARGLACNFMVHNPTPPDKFIGKSYFPLYFQRYSALQCGAPEVKFLQNDVKQKDVKWLPRVAILLDEPPENLNREGGTNFAELEVDVTSVDVEPNSNGLPNIYIRASLRKSDFYKWSLHKGEAKPRKQSTGSTNLEAQSAQSGLEPHNVLGIQLGQTIGEAEAIVRKRMGDELIAYDTHPDPMIDQPPFQFARVFMRADGTEKILIYHEPDSPQPDKVLAVHRTWDATNTAAVNGPAVFAAAKRKFGPPDVMNETSGLTIAWGKGTKGSSEKYTDNTCVLGENYLFPSTWKDESGTIASVFDFPQWQRTGRQLRLSHGPGMTNYSDDGLRNHYARCGPYLVINFQNGERLLDTKLIDTPGYIAAFLAARENRKEAIETTVETEKEFDL